MLPIPLARLASWAVVPLLVVACSPRVDTPSPPSTVPASAIADPLPSWNEGPSRTAILELVKAVTTEGGPDFVPVSQRIATFDNDGTLWSEQPMYFQVLFVLDRVRAMAADHPDWKARQPFKAALDGDMKALAAAGERGIVQLIMATHTGMTVDEFAATVREWTDDGATPHDEAPVHADDLPTDGRAPELPARHGLQDLHRVRRRHRVHAAVGGAGLRRSA